MEITFLSTKEPVTLEIKHPKLNFSDITFENLDAFLFTPEGLKGELKSSKTLIYKDHDELYDIYAILYFSDHNDTLKAKKAHYKGNILHLTDDITYRSNNTFLLKSDDLVYNIDTEVAVSQTPFLLEQNGSKATGNHLVYDAIKREVKAEDVVFTIEEEDQ